jgi:drug/metabolite transporter (DMT)-like permease
MPASDWPLAAAGRHAPRDRGAHREGVVLLVTVVLAWGLTWPVNKAILDYLPPVWMLALRSAIATLALLVLATARRRLVLPPRADWPVLASITLLHMVGFTVLSTWGLERVSTGRSVVLAYTTPLWVAPGASLFLGERLTPRRLVGVVVGLLGLLALFNPLDFDWADRRAVLGNGAIVLAAVLWAASILHIRGHRWRSTPFDLVPWELLSATVILGPLAMATSGAPAVHWNGRLVLLLLYAGLVGTALAYWAMAVASRNLPAVTTSLGSLGTPVVSVVVAALWLGEVPTVPLIAAIALILGGVAIGATGDAHRRASAPMPP